MVRTTSTSFISGTGLKKCSPINRSGRFHRSQNSSPKSKKYSNKNRNLFFTTGSSDGIHLLLPSQILNDGLNHNVQSARSDLFVVHEAVPGSHPSARR